MLGLNVRILVERLPQDELPRLTHALAQNLSLFGLLMSLRQLASIMVVNVAEI